MAGAAVFVLGSLTGCNSGKTVKLESMLPADDKLLNVVVQCKGGKGDSFLFIDKDAETFFTSFQKIEVKAASKASSKKTDYRVDIMFTSGNFVSADGYGLNDKDGDKYYTCADFDTEIKAIIDTMYDPTAGTLSRYYVAEGATKVTATDRMAESLEKEKIELTEAAEIEDLLDKIGQVAMNPEPNDTGNQSQYYVTVEYADGHTLTIDGFGADNDGVHHYYTTEQFDEVIAPLYAVAD